MKNIIFWFSLIFLLKYSESLNPDIKISSDLQTLNKILFNIIQPLAKLELQKGIFIKGPLSIKKKVLFSTFTINFTNLNVTYFSLNWTNTKLKKISNSIIQLEINDLNVNLINQYSGHYLFVTEKGNGSINLEGVKITIQISFKSSKTGALIDASIYKCSFRLFFVK